ncbi:MAG TPA: tRNA lysidine(34) synthetase TilS, partial [Oceanipulchritudo sp.]|nr:tRNA lysidine(34) synthetase TilS [Oceanipulchritudo sp.]
MSRCMAALRPTEWIEPKVGEFLHSLPADRPVLVACSGGADSVFLTLALLAWFDGDSSRLAIGHFNHGLRGAESDGDETYVREMAEALGIRFLSGRAEESLTRDEAALRKARYNWLSIAYKSVKAGGLALGQHADDLVESLLMGIFTGSGPSGLASPMPMRQFPDGEVRLRPLLRLKREQILKTLTSLGISWREDRSNADPAYTRNWLRQAVVPQLRERFPQDIHAAASRTRQLMEEVLEALDAQVRSLTLDTTDPQRLDTSTLTGQPVGLVRRAFLGWWMRHHAVQLLATGLVDGVVQQISAGRPGRAVDRFVLGWDRVLWLVDSGGEAVIAWRTGSHWDWQAGPLFLPDGGILHGQLRTWLAGESPYTVADPAREAWLSGVEGPIEVRPWEPGDRYQPLG